MKEITSISPLHLVPVGSTNRSARSTRRKADGAATAATLIQMASEILSASPTLRHKLNITLADLSAAEKVRKELSRKAIDFR